LCKVVLMERRLSLGSASAGSLRHGRMGDRQHKGESAA
jgi:hypothetical protein